MILGDQSQKQTVEAYNNGKKLDIPHPGLPRVAQRHHERTRGSAHAH